MKTNAKLDIYFGSTFIEIHLLFACMIINGALRIKVYVFFRGRTYNVLALKHAFIAATNKLRLMVSPYRRDKESAIVLIIIVTHMAGPFFDPKEHNLHNVLDVLYIMIYTSNNYERILPFLLKYI